MKEIFLIKDGDGTRLVADGFSGCGVISSSDLANHSDSAKVVLSGGKALFQQIKIFCHTNAEYLRGDGGTPQANFLKTALWEIVWGMIDDVGRVKEIFSQEFGLTFSIKMAIPTRVGIVEKTEVWERFTARPPDDILKAVAVYQARLDASAD